VALVSVSDYNIPDPTTPSTQESSSDISIDDDPSYFTTPTTNHVSAVVQPLLRIFEESGRDCGFLFSGRVFVCIHGLVFLPAEQ